jgi:hypothetical protein
LPAHASPQERVDAFRRLVTRTEWTVRTTTCRNTGGCSTTAASSIELGDGTVVRHADDLLPVLPADGAAARNARASARARRRKHIATLVSLGASIGGVALLYDRLHRDTGSTRELKAGLGMLLVAGISAVVYGVSNAQEEDRRVAAFRTYPDELAAHLRLCSTGLALVACEAQNAINPTTPAVISPGLDALPRR